MPNLATSLALVETATKCLAIALLVFERCQAPGAGRVGVGQRFQRRECLGRDDEQRFGRIEIARRLGQVGAVDVRDKAERQIAVAVVPQRFIRHDRAEVGAADADVDDVFDPLAGVALPLAAANAIGKVGHLVEHGMNLGDDVLAIDDDRRPRGARRATCSTARFSVVLIFSPANIAVAAAGDPDSSANWTSSLNVSSVTRFFE